MEEIPPSYESAVTRDYWTIIARYIPSNDLCTAALVSKRWHRTFAPHLWGNPASHFGTQDDMIYVALTRFKRTLSWARISVRELTHTLHLPSGHAETYGGPHSDWLRDILERLPKLQSLIVNGIPFFDHASLLTLRHHSPVKWGPFRKGRPVYGIRLLDASSCSNATSRGLTEALSHLPMLLYLNLSKTLAARDAGVLNALRSLTVLRVLKLRGLALKDEDMEILVAAFGMRVRSLDVRNNHLTDQSARFLLDTCFLDTSTRYDGQNRVQSPLSRVFPYNQYSQKGFQLDRYLSNWLTKGFTGHLAIEDPVETGITDLYISDNKLTVEGVSGLIRSGRLQILDVGTLNKSFHRPQPIPNSDFEEEFTMPGAEKLVKVLKDCAAGKLTYLRIHHSLITAEASQDDLIPTRAELLGDLGLHRPADAQELDSAAVILNHELPADLPPSLANGQHATSQAGGSNVEPISVSAARPAAVNVAEGVELVGDGEFPVELEGSSVQITLTSPQPSDTEEHVEQSVDQQTEPQNEQQTEPQTERHTEQQAEQQTEQQAEQQTGQQAEQQDEQQNQQGTGEQTGQQTEQQTDQLAEPEPRPREAEVRRRSVDAPEPVIGTPDLANNPARVSSSSLAAAPALISNNGLGITAIPHSIGSTATFDHPVSPTVVHHNDCLSPVSPINSPTTFQFPKFEGAGLGAELGSSLRRRTSSIRAQDRRDRLEMRQSQEHFLHPGMLPKIHTLVLTGVPTHTIGSSVADRLIQFIKDCAEESEIAKLQARSAYALPPGRSRAVAEREFATSVFTLRRIVLEMASQDGPASPKSIASWRQYPTRSATEDADSEAFWSAAENDFSFFGGEKRHSLSDHGSAAYSSFFQTNETMMSSSPESDGAITPGGGRLMTPLLVPNHDTIAHIAQFRKDRKMAHEAAIRNGQTDATADGYWKGDVTVIRNPTLETQGNSGDYYRYRSQNDFYR